MDLSSLKPAAGSTKRESKRLGRGQGQWKRWYFYKRA